MFWIAQIRLPLVPWSWKCLHKLKIYLHREKKGKMQCEKRKKKIEWKWMFLTFFPLYNHSSHDFDNYCRRHCLSHYLIIFKKKKKMKTGKRTKKSYLWAFHMVAWCGCYPESPNHIDALADKSTLHVRMHVRRCNHRSRLGTANWT